MLVFIVLSVLLILFGTGALFIGFQDDVRFFGLVGIAFVILGIYLMFLAGTFKPQLDSKTQKWEQLQQAQWEYHEAK